jgi:hypothetical protein
MKIKLLSMALISSSLLLISSCDAFTLGGKVEFHDDIEGNDEFDALYGVYKTFAKEPYNSKNFTMTKTEKSKTVYTYDVDGAYEHKLFNDELKEEHWYFKDDKEGYVDAYIINNSKRYKADKEWYDSHVQGYRYDLMVENFSDLYDSDPKNLDGFKFASRYKHDGEIEDGVMKSSGTFELSIIKDNNNKLEIKADTVNGLINKATINYLNSGELETSVLTFAYGKTVINLPKLSEFTKVS